MKDKQINGIDEIKLDDNFFKVPNEYKDALCRTRIPGQARQILDVIERMTIGWRRRQAKISLKTFRKMTGLRDKHIIKGRRLLQKMRIISTPHKGSRKELYYRILTDYSNWKPLPKKGVKKDLDQSLPKKEVKTTPQLGNKPLPKKVTTNPVAKDINIKDIIYKDSETTDDKISLMKIIKELKEDLKREKYPGELDYKRKGIQDLIERVKELNDLYHSGKKMINRKSRYECDLKCNEAK